MDQRLPCGPDDQFATHLGIGAIAVEPERARAELRVAAQHINAAGLLHGGAIFSLADAAVALAANVDGIAVVVASQIQFLEPAAIDDRLVATAEIEYRRGRRAGYRVRVTRGEQLVACGTSQTQRLDG